MRTMTTAYMHGAAGFARVRTAFRSQPAAALPVHSPWLHVVCIDGKTGTTARRLGGLSP